MLGKRAFGDGSLECEPRDCRSDLFGGGSTGIGTVSLPCGSGHDETNPASNFALEKFYRRRYTRDAPGSGTSQWTSFGSRVIVIGAEDSNPVGGYQIVRKLSRPAIGKSCLRLRNHTPNCILIHSNFSQNLEIVIFTINCTLHLFKICSEVIGSEASIQLWSNYALSVFKNM